MTDHLSYSIVRLQDPTHCARDARQLKELQDKISNVMAGLFRKPTSGGNPFLFALCGPKPHFLAKELPGMKDFHTAATDGKNFFWHPDFLESLDNFQAQQIMNHESYHVLFFHCNGARNQGKNPSEFGIACDFVVNGVIAHEHDKSGRSKKFPLWGGGMGTPILFGEYLDYIMGNKEIAPGPTCFADASKYGCSPESMYSEIIEAKLKSPRRCKEDHGGCGALSIDPKTGRSKIELPWELDACQKCGAKPNYGPGSMDSHMPSKVSKEEVMSEMIRASQQAESLGRGLTPDAVTAALGELAAPTLMAHQIIRQSFMRKALDVGAKNDYKRYRKRSLAMGGMVVPGVGTVPAMYIPKKYEHKPTYLVLMDTSGSMSDKDIANGLKEMQAVGPNAEGIVVPCDAVPYWDKMTRINRTTDLQRTTIHGRGGTVFDEFFRDYPTKVGTNFDCIVIISDGDCGHIPPELRPRADVLWIITNNREFKPSFGRVCQLTPSRN